MSGHFSGHFCSADGFASESEEYKELKLKVFRVIAISLPQLLLLLDVGARFDLLFGFNRTDYGFTLLLFLFVLVPFVSLSWFLGEVIMAVRLARRQDKKMSFRMPGLALLILAEAVLFDLFLLSQARM